MLNPEDYKKYTGETRSQLFELFIENKLENLNEIFKNISKGFETIESKSTLALRKLIWEDRENFKEEVYKYLNATMDRKKMEETQLPDKPSFWRNIFKRK